MILTYFLLTSFKEPSTECLFLKVISQSLIHPIFHIDVQRIEADSRKMETFYKVHGIMMIISYVLLATLGIFTSRYIRRIDTSYNNNNNSNNRRPQIWLVAHVTVMTVFIICVLSSFAVVVAQVGGWSKKANTHHYVGMASIVATLVQPLLGIVRPARTHKRRYVFNMLHFVVGSLSWLLGCCAIVFAFRMFGRERLPILIFMVVVVLLFILCDILLRAQDRRKVSWDMSVYVIPHVDGDMVKMKVKDTPDEDGGSLGFGKVGIVAMFFCATFVTCVVFTQYIIAQVALW